MGIQRSPFYNWKGHLANPSHQLRNLAKNIALFKEYHIKFPCQSLSEIAFFSPVKIAKISPLRLANNSALCLINLNRWPFG